MNNENLIGVYLKLLGVLECPVCLDYLTKPVGLCQQGHALCSGCKTNLTNCPMCRSAISSTRGLILDQIIETLLYPCYKMGCGSLLKRSDAEFHDQRCPLDVASDKQTVLHNNLLKNIEENFSSFIVQTEVPKETRTIGTLTGKVKTCDARIQTVLPFLIMGSPQICSENGTDVNLPGSSSTATNPTGVSIISQNAQDVSVGSNNSIFNFPMNSSDQKPGFTIMNTWNTSIAPPRVMKKVHYRDQKANVFSPNILRKPSTNLNFNFGVSSQILGTEPMVQTNEAENGFDGNEMSRGSIPSTSNKPIHSITSNVEELSQIKAKSKAGNTPLGPTAASNEPRPAVTPAGILPKKKPTTNLFHIITQA